MTAFWDRTRSSICGHRPRCSPRPPTWRYGRHKVAAPRPHRPGLVRPHSRIRKHRVESCIVLWGLHHVGEIMSSDNVLPDGEEVEEQSEITFAWEMLPRGKTQ